LKSWSSIGWSPTHSPFSLGIHVWIILVLTSFVWLHRARMRWCSMGFMLFWICIQIGWYYKWTSIMPSIPYHGQPIFRSYNLLPIFWINISHLFDDFRCAHQHYISCKLFNMKISQSLHPNLAHDNMILWV